RTSPTNIGLYLLSVVAARDFGWLGTLDALERIEATVATMDKLERFRGHFYNWYETRDLHALEPKYVSSVDSGNLAGHLIAMANACREIIAGPVGNPHWMKGIEDNLTLVRESARPPTADRRSPEPAYAALETAIETFAEALREPPLRPSDIACRLDDLAPKAETLTERARVWSQARNDTVS